MFVKLCLTVKDYVNDRKWYKYGRVIFWFILLIIFLIISFTGYGPGEVELYKKHEKPQKKTVKVNMDSVRKETEKKIPHSLKRQKDPGFEEEQKKAEEYLKSLNLDKKP